MNAVCNLGIEKCIWYCYEGNSRESINKEIIYAAISEFPLMPEGRGAKWIPFSLFNNKLAKYTSNKTH